MPSVVAGSERGNFNDALTDLVNGKPTVSVLASNAVANKLASKTPAKQRKIKVSERVDTVCSHAYERGIPEDALSTLIDIITLNCHLDQGSKTTIIKNLYPSNRVSNDVVFRVMGALGPSKGKPSAVTQALLVKWLILVYEVLVDPSVLSKLYGVLFNLLDMISLRAPLCHLLSLITRRKHVRPYRIQMLLELCSTMDHEPAFVGFLRVFQDYYPDVIVGNATAGRASYFSHPNPEWRERLLLIQEAQTRELGPQPQQASFKVVRRGTKRSRVSVVPELRTARASEISVTLEEIENVDDFVGRLERIELPNQVISALGDPLFQKYLVLKPSETASKRLNQWLSTFFDEELHLLSHGQHEHKRLSEMLEKLLNYTRYTKILCSSAETFLESYIDHWDATMDGRTLLELLSYLPMRPFSDLQEVFLTPIEAVVLDGSVESKTIVLEFYTSLLRQWTALLLDQSSTGTANLDISLSAFTDLTLHADRLCLSTLESLPLTLASISSVLSFYETVATSISHSPTNPNIRITTPSAEVIYRLTFTTSLSTLSRLCSILSTYKTAFEAGMTRASDGNGYPREYVNHFNGFLMDICNCLWRNRALNREDTNALGCLVPPTVVPALRTYATSLGHSLPTLFSLSNSSTLCALSIACFRGLEDAAAEAEEGSLSIRLDGPVSQRSLTVLGNEGGLKISWGNYRLEVLKWLEERGVRGVRELMFNTMKHLMSAKGAGTAL